jgi:DNA-binding response OmpR family regulator
MDVKKALLCDDDKTTMMIVKHLLQKAGFAVSMAGNGKEGLALIQTEKPDLVVLDLNMPDMDGVAVLKALKKAPGEKPYIIILSSHENNKISEYLRDLGAEEMILKPFKPAELIEKAQTLMREGSL